MRTSSQFLIFALGLIVSLHISTGSNSQDRFKHYTTEDGYAGPGSAKFAQDSLGFLWIKTGGGLYQFDGFNFRVKKANPKDSLSLKYDSGDDIFIDKQGNLWALDGKDICMYDRNIDGFKAFNIGYDVLTLSFDENENVVWVGTYQEGLIRYNPALKEILEFKSEPQKNTTIFYILDRGSSLLLATAQGLWIFDKKTQTFIKPKGDVTYSVQLAESPISRIFEHDGFYWLYTPLGLYKTDSNFNVHDIFYFKDICIKFDHTKSFKDPLINGVDLDNLGNFWIASRGLGLIRFNTVSHELKNYRHDPTNSGSILTDEIVGVMVDRDQNVWVSEFGRGIGILKRQSIDFYNPMPGVSANGMQIIKEKMEVQLIVSTEINGLVKGSFRSGPLQGLARFRTSPDHTNLSSYGECVRGKNFLWITLRQQGVMGIPINPSTGVLEHDHVRIMNHDPKNENTLSSSVVSEMWEDDDNNLWVGNLSDGLNKVDLSIPYGEIGSVKRFYHNDSDPNSINGGNWITALYPEDSLSHWVCTQTGIDLYRNNRFEHVAEIIGTMCFTKTLKGLIIVGTKSGLYSGALSGGKYQFNKIEALGDLFITSVQEDKLGRLWIASLQGLYCYNLATKYLMQFKEEDGVQATRFSIAGTGSTQTPEGVMIFSGSNGISVFDPMSFKISESAPKPVITELRVNNKKITSDGNLNEDNFQTFHHINLLKELELSYKQHIFSFEFSSMQLTSPKKNNYRYKLEGFDKEWVETDWKNRLATYTNLDPGTYVFRVKASNYDGVWNEKETTLTIHILPPPWRTWWAYLIYTILLLSLLWLARRMIVQRERLTARLDIERIELEKARELDRLKSSFFTNISHEFRTPLTLIKGPAQSLLEEFPANALVARKIGTIQQNADQLLKLINQLLELSRMESNAATVEMLDGDLVVYLNRIAQSFSSLAFQKKISYKIEIPYQSIVAKFDKSKLEVIASNLISNALKFSDAGQSVLFKATIDNSKDDFHLIMTVADTGMGIDTKELDRIFDRFYQINTSHKEIGTGIGLALVKEFTQLMGGAVTVASDISKGSEFKVIIPIEILTCVEENAELSSTVKNEFFDLTKEVTLEPAKPKVLVVEDNYGLRNYIIESLGEEYDFIEAENGKIGLQLAIAEIPEMIITDLMMPEMDGGEMTTLIKKDTRTNHIPVIMLTARATDEDKLSGLQQGADDYLTKPFNKSELVLKVKNSLTIRAKIRARLKQELEAEASEPKTLSADEHFLFKVKSAIQKRITDEKFSVETLAEEMNMSRVQLYRKVSALTGLSVIELIRGYRLQHAAKLLKKGTSVSQVAFEIGFSNHSHFSRLFKEKYGVFPSEYH